MEPNKLYQWEMEAAGGIVRRQYNESGIEQTWKDLPLERIIRVTFLPLVPVLPRHDIFIDINKGERFVRRFGRGFIKQADDGFKLREYINCCVTERYRVYVISTTGQTIVTRPDYEVYL